MSKVYLPTKEQFARMNKQLSNIATALGTQIDTSTWAGIQTAVRAGVAPQLFPVGTQLSVNHGLVVECTPAWDNKVQITSCNCNKSGYHRRNWTKHGKLPYIKYVSDSTAITSNVSTDSFLPSRGYFKKGDVSANVGKIATFMRKTFPSYTSEKALGNTYGTYLIKAVTEFQKRTGLEADGYFGKLTLAKLEEYGFKK